ncbi:MAG: GvpL/GvpF family gas vesicle protein [Elainella sp.]
MYTYAFLFNSGLLPELPEGIWGSLELIGADRLAALVEPGLSAEALQQSDRQLMQAVLSHDRVIQEVFQQTTVLPLRFGTYFISRQGLLDHLYANQQTYIDKLTQLQGKAEYVLKLNPLPFPEAAIAAETTGKDYFLAKKQRYQDQTSWQQQQQAELNRLTRLLETQYVWSRAEPDSTASTTERIYLLADGDRSLQEQLPTWQQQCPSWELVLGEPLPPYHFV